MSATPRTSAATLRRAASHAVYTVLAALFVGCGGGGNSQQQPASGQVELINGVQVPPAPDPTVNQATLRGVDSNSNGIRDDIDRLLASDFGTDSRLHQEVQNFYRLQALAMQTPTPANVDAYVAALNCIGTGDRLAKQRQITDTVLDTAERRLAYATAFAGIRVSSQDCVSSPSLAQDRPKALARVGAQAALRKR